MEPYGSHYWAWDVTRDPTAIGDDAGPVPEPTDAKWDDSLYCRRCGTPLTDSLYFCKPCNDDFWDRAASYSDDQVEKDRIVTNLRRRFINGTA